MTKYNNLIKYFSLVAIGMIVAGSAWLLYGKVQDVLGAATRGDGAGSLIGYWNMDNSDTNGTTLYDKSGNNYNGTIVSSVVKAKGKVNEALHTEGAIDVQVDGFTHGDTLTYSLWVKTGVVDANDTMIDTQNIGAADTGMGIYTTNGSNLLVRVDDGGTQTTLSATSPQIFDSEWHHIVATKDSADLVSIYIDGALNNSQTLAIGDISSSNSLGIGSVNGAGFNWQADYDEVRIYNYALSAQEVGQLYASAKTSYTETATRTGLVGYWNMDANDLNGTSLYDKSGLNNHGTMTGTTLALGKVNQSRNFNGSSDQITMGNPTSLQITGNLTLSAWVKTTGASTQRIISKDNADAGTRSYLMYMNSSGGASIGIFKSNVFNESGASTAKINDGEWHHVVGINDGTNLKMYIDGVADTSAANGGVIDNDVVNFDIGVLSGTADANFWNGDIDEVRVYNKALSDSEIIDLYNVTKANYAKTPSRTSLTLDLDMGNNNGGATPTVYDTSGKSRHAVAQNAQTCNQNNCIFDGSTDYMVANTTGIFNQTNVSLAIKFSPDFSPTNGSQYFIVDTGTSLGVSVLKTTGNALQVYMGGTIIASFSPASYAQYWKVGQDNVMIITATSGNNNFYLNGNLLGSSVTAWTPTDYTTLQIGRRSSGIQYYDGNMSYLKVWNRLLTDNEVQDLSADRINHK